MSKENGHPQYTIFAKKWFDKVNGNTYHTVEVFKDGKSVAVSDRTYGYGDAYMQTAHELLQGTGDYPETGERLTSGFPKDYYEFQNDMREHRDCFEIRVIDVTRKKDL